MDDKQRMTHPDLPDAEIWARPKQVPVREASGWVLAPQEDAPVAVDPPAPITTKKAPATPAAMQEG